MAEHRRINMVKMLEMIQHNPSIKRSKLIALFCLQTGLRRQTINEYISELEAAGLIEKDE